MRFAEALRPRAPISDTLHLGLRNLYILPTRFGWHWLAGTALMQLVAIQVRSNGTLLLSFVMLAVMLLAMHLTHENLDGLVLRCDQPATGFASQAVAYPLQISSRAPRLRLRLLPEHGEPVEMETLARGTTCVRFLWQPSTRGLHPPNPLRVESSAPLGLFVCWSRWQPSEPQLIAPARRPGPVRVLMPKTQQQGLEEWQDLKPHRPGERLALSDWRSLAKGRPLQTKQFSDPAPEPLLLQAAAGVEREQALEHLADRIWRLHQQGEAYGLKLDEKLIAPQSGLLHRDTCLMALALA
jgi:uncharacterized protein (DUF58 family)